MDPALLAEALDARARAGKLPKAVVPVHLYGQSADMDPILAACERYGVPVIEDAAEALGATYKGAPPGTFGQGRRLLLQRQQDHHHLGRRHAGVGDRELIEHARKLATQARDPAPHYQHSEIGYNYRLSNVLAAIGRGQLRGAGGARARHARRIFEFYRQALGDLPGIAFMPEAPWGRATRWLTCITVDPAEFGADREAIRLALEAENIESRPVWKPMHLQPVFAGCQVVGGAVAQACSSEGLCLPSGTALTDDDLARVVDVVRRVAGHGASAR